MNGEPLQGVRSSLDGQLGKLFFLEGLAGWSCPLHRRLTERITAAPGTFWTLAPLGASHERLHDFRSGGLLPAETSGVVETPSTLKELAVLLREHFTGRELLLFDPVAKPDDPLTETAPEVRVDGDNVYRTLSLLDASTSTIARQIASTNALFHSLGVVSTPLAERSVSGRIDAQELLHRADGATVAFQTAYDGESYVVWEPAPSGG
ncbi:MAG: hypothetical protein AAGK22_14905 [Acidobacteriota bacterium]